MHNIFTHEQQRYELQSTTTTTPMTTTTVVDHPLLRQAKPLMLIGLDLSGTELTDNGLAYFKDSKNLTLLQIQRTKVSAAKVDEIRKAMPKCRIESDHGTFEAK